jgi:hypothetical protein
MPGLTAAQAALAGAASRVIHCQASTAENSVRSIGTPIARAGL